MSTSPASDSPQPDTAFSRWNFIHSFWSLGFVSISSLAFNVILARILGIEDVGHIRVIRSVIEFAYLPAGVGMSIAAGKFAADARASSDRRRASLAIAMRASLAASLIVAFAIFAVSWWPGMLKDQTARRMLHVMVWLIPIVSAARAHMSYLQGMNQIRLLATQQAARSFAMLGVGAALIALAGLNGWAAGMFATELIALMIILPMTGMGLGLRARADDIAALRPKMIRFGLSIAATQTLQTAFVSLDVLFLDRFHGDPAAIAQYGMATLILTASMLVPQSLIQSHFAKIAAHGHDPETHWKHFAVFVSRAMGAIIVAAVIGYFCTPVVRLIFGDAYERTGLILSWLIPAFVLQSAGQLTGTFVINAGLAREHLITMAITTVIFMALCFALIPGFGVAGACGAVTCAYAVRAATSVLILHLYRRGKLSPGTQFAAE